MLSTSLENKLIDWASYQQEDVPNRDMVAQDNWDELTYAYQRCKEVTFHHSKSFSLAASMLSPEQRRATHALYAFCRVTDDIADDFDGDRVAELESWQNRAIHGRGIADDKIALAWLDARAKFNVPTIYAEQLINGVKRDFRQNRYETFDDLVTYCYGVASTVGLMSMHIIGFRTDDAIPYAVKLGVALQLTNILRDIREDWARNRIYLPQEELAFFGIEEADFDAGVIDYRWRSLLKFQIERARQLYEDALPGIEMLNPAGRMAIAAASTFYRGILDDIEANDYDVFSRRAHVTKWGKLKQVPTLWWQYGRGGKQA